MMFHDKRILVTGADGFIGSHLVEALLEEGASIRALAQYNAFNSWGWLEAIPRLGEVDVVTGDIRDAGTCRKITRDMDIVFHLAALIAIPYSYEAPESYVRTNVEGTLHLCQAALENRCSRFIQTSTSEVYGTAQYVPVDEQHPLRPQSPYSASKLGGDSIALSYHFAFGLPVTIARPFNTYGPRQSARAVIPAIITQLAQGFPEIRLGDTAPTRDFTYVTDTCRGLLSLAGNEALAGETVNIGTGSEIGIRALFDMIARLMKKSAVLTSDPVRKRPEKSEVMRLLCDNGKLRRLTGFTPEISLEQGLSRTIAWYSSAENLKRFKAGVYNT